jgi:hypothetical protein
MVLFGMKRNFHGKRKPVRKLSGLMQLERRKDRTVP